MCLAPFEGLAGGKALLNRKQNDFDLGLFIQGTLALILNFSVFHNV